MFGSWKKIVSLLAIAFEFSILIDMLMADVSILKDFDQLLALPSREIKFTGFWGHKKAKINMSVGECKLIIAIANVNNAFTPQIVNINGLFLRSFFVTKAFTGNDIQPCDIDLSLKFKDGKVKGNAVSCAATCDPKFASSTDRSEELIKVKITQLPKGCNITAVGQKALILPVCYIKNAARISPGNPKKTNWTIPIVIAAVSLTVLLLSSIASSLLHKYWWKKRHERKADDANPAGPTITSQEVTRDAKPVPVVVKNENVDKLKGNTKPSAELVVQTVKPTQVAATQQPTAVKNPPPKR
ncbi:hypothetical protein M3Y96_00443600 [Aphelenchoides besseyi]|nr:hypothetical protein M3Y96_00443600 [Aphelenchoides besseyi]